MCELHQVRRIGRRTWVTRSAAGLLGLWAAPAFGSGRQGWGVLLSGRPRNVSAAQGGDRFLPVGIEVQSGGQTVPITA